jgi:hypothetical protein
VFFVLSIAWLARTFPRLPIVMVMRVALAFFLSCTMPHTEENLY